MQPNKQQFLKEQDPTGKHSIIIFNKDFEVRAPLPESYGMTYGSEYSMPFDTQALSEAWQKAFAVVGVANKVGLRMQKLYTSPEPTEISFEMEFNAYYSAADEVLLPAFYLSQMTLGTALKLEDLAQSTEDFVKKLSNFTNKIGTTVGLGEINNDSINIETSDTVNENVNGVLRLVGFIQSPKSVNVYFGNVMAWEEMYITSVATQFSNSLDSNGIPMSATCTITITPKMYPIAEEMQQVFTKAIGRV